MKVRNGLPGVRPIVGQHPIPPGKETFLAGDLNRHRQQLPAEPGIRRIELSEG